MLINITAKHKHVSIVNNEDVTVLTTAFSSEHLDCVLCIVLLMSWLILNDRLLSVSLSFLWDSPCAVCHKGRVIQKIHLLSQELLLDAVPPVPNYHCQSALQFYFPALWIDDTIFQPISPDDFQILAFVGSPHSLRHTLCTLICTELSLGCSTAGLHWKKGTPPPTHTHTLHLCMSPCGTRCQNHVPALLYALTLSRHEPSIKHAQTLGHINKHSSP